MSLLNENQAMVENIGQSDQQIEPVFDADAHETDIDISDTKALIIELFPNKPIIMLNEHPENIKEK